MGEFGDQLKKLRGALSQREAARRSGISQQMWSKLETAAASAEDSVSVYKIADAFDVEVETIDPSATGIENIRFVAKRGGTLEVREDHPEYNVPGRLAARPEHYPIPQLDFGGSMGGGREAPDHIDVVNQMRVNLPQLKREVSFSAPQNLRIITGYGDSMEPTFKDGDPLLMDTGVNDFAIDGVYCFQKEGAGPSDSIFIKRIQRHPIDNTVIVSSDNRNYQPYVVPSSKTGFRILGRVLLAWNSRKL